MQKKPPDWPGEEVPCDFARSKGRSRRIDGPNIPYPPRVASRNLYVTVEK